MLAFFTMPRPSFSIDDTGKSVQLQLGAEFSILLKENAASSGYRWSLAARMPGSIALEPPAATTPEPSSKPGAAAIREFRFRCVAEGAGALVLELRRPWEQNTSAAERMELRVEVKPGPAA